MLILMGIIETMLFWVNSWLVFSVIGAHDVGGGMVTQGLDASEVRVSISDAFYVHST